MSSMPGGRGRPQPSVGLCERCAFARVQHNARGSAFWRCGRAESDVRFLRYPPIPVLSCPGHEAGRPRTAPEGPEPGC